MAHPVFSSPAWNKLRLHAEQMASTNLLELFQQNPQRFEKFSLQAAGLLLDYSKNLITEETLQLWQPILEQIKILDWQKAMFAGEKINNTEQRAVLHTALRTPEAEFSAPKMIHRDIQEVQERMRQIVQTLHAQQWLGFSGQPIRDVVNIGIGGSDLGPQMVVEALAPYRASAINCHFISNVDASQITQLLKSLNPETTLFIVASKTFTTIETLTNATTAREWLQQAGCSTAALAQHFIGITAKADQAVAFGIARERILPMWDWVGGRYSLWSAIGLPIAIFVGMENFLQLLQGAHAMDQHFRAAPLLQNMPVILALLETWYIHFFQAKSHAILPYDHYLRRFPAYLQQLEMESSGKQCQRNGEAVFYPTGAVIWGEPGTNGQHAFHQLLHQGTHFIPIDFIAAVNNHHDYQHHQEILFANCLAQAQALMIGQKIETGDQALAPHQMMPGNRPSNMLLMAELTPQTLGALIALYEHKVFVQGIIWNINSFDQWGVELGKQLANKLLPDLQTPSKNFAHDLSTQGLLAYYHSHKKLKG